MPDGKKVHAGTANKLIEKGLLVPNGDGMLGAPSQTYKPNLV